MTNTLQDIAVPEGAMTNPQSLVRTGISRFFFGSRFAIGLVIFLIGIAVILMISKRFGLPTGAIERVVS